MQLLSHGSYTQRHRKGTGVLSLMSDFINCHVSLVPLDGCGPSAGH